jgi:hypothetical protein
MPEGTRRTPTDVTLKYMEYSQNNIDGYRFYSFYISGDNYLDLPLDANVRLPSEKSIPYKEMVKTLEKNPSYFLLQNSGINVIATKVKVDKQKKSVELHFPPNTGIVNGGHTQLAILDVKKDRDISEARIRLDILENNFTSEQLAIIASSKNTASNVKPYSTAEKKGLFLKIKNEMLDQFEKHIIWYENRDVPNNQGFPAVDLIALINLFNVKNFQSDHNRQSNEQPNKSATSKTSVFKDWESNPNNYEHVYPLINDIINLHDHILSTFDQKIPKGFTNLSVIKNLKGKTKKTIFAGKNLKFELPKQFFLPILASIRAAIKFDDINDKVGWYEKPEDIFDKCKTNLISDLTRQFKTAYHNEINRASKDPGLWRILYSDVEKLVDKTKTWKTYDA